MGNFQEDGGKDISVYRALLLRRHEEIQSTGGTETGEDSEIGDIGANAVLPRSNRLCSSRSEGSGTYYRIPQYRPGRRNSMPCNSTNGSMCCGTSSPTPLSLYPIIGSGSPPSFAFDSASIGSTSGASVATATSKMSAFYQAALEEAMVTEEEEEEAMLQQQRVSSLEQNHSNQVENDTNDERTIGSPTRNVKNCGGDYNLTDASSISPFYLSALEDAALVEEEELELLEQQKQELEQAKAQDQQDKKHHASKSCDTAIQTTTYTPSSFYQSALEEAVLVEQELGSQEDTEEGGEEDDPAVMAAIAAAASSIQERPATVMVHQEAMRSGSFAHEATDSDEFLGRDSHRDGPRLIPDCSFSSSYDYSDPISKSQRLILNASSFSSPARLSIETEASTPDRRSRSSVDDNSPSFVTRSSSMHIMMSSFLPATREQPSIHARADSWVEKDAFRDAHDLAYTDNGLQGSHHRDDDEECLRLGLYLSRLESSTVSSMHSEGSRSCSIVSAGTRSPSSELDEDSQKINRTDRFSCVSAPTASNMNDNEFLVSQAKAMEEYQKKSIAETSRRSSAPPTVPLSDQPYPKNITTTTASSASSTATRERRQARRRSLLEMRGASETRKSISNGNSRVVKCKGCKGRLQAPVHYSLVFCPKCQTISPA